MSDRPQFYARVSDDGRRQPLAEHLRNVARLARRGKAVFKQSDLLFSVLQESRGRDSIRVTVSRSGKGP